MTIDPNAILIAIGGGAAVLTTWRISGSAQWRSLAEARAESLKERDGQLARRDGEIGLLHSKIGKLEGIIGEMRIQLAEAGGRPLHLERLEAVIADSVLASRARDETLHAAVLQMGGSLDEIARTLHQIDQRGASTP